MAQCRSYICSKCGYLMNDDDICCCERCDLKICYICQDKLDDKGHEYDYQNCTFKDCPRCKLMDDKEGQERVERLFNKFKKKLTKREWKIFKYLYWDK